MSGTKLTDLAIKKLKAKPGKRYFKLEPGGFGVRVGREKVFVVRYTFDGKRKWFILGTYPAISLEEARIEAGNQLLLVKKGIDPGEQKKDEDKAYSEAPTVHELIQEFWNKKLSNLKSGQETRRLLEKDLLKPWGERKTASIKKRDVALLLDDVGARAPVTRNRLHTAITNLFNFAAARGIIEDSPCGGLDRIEEKTRSRALDDDEIKILWESLDLENSKVFDAYPLTKLALKMILLTGQRPGEVAGMELSEITEREDGPWWEIPAERMKGKNATAHDVPLSPMALEVLDLAKIYSGKSKYIFRSSFKKDAPISVRAVSRSVARHWENLCIDKFTPHDLRRTCRTGLANLKVSDIVAEKVLSHKLQGVLGIYNRATYEPERRAALDLWGNHIKCLVDPEGTADINMVDLNSYRVVKSI